MTGDLDPYRVLGVARGASTDEIRRAYRRLAKINHPDAAGEAALPRFLAIQAAYEMLVVARRGRQPGARPGSSSRGPAAGPDAARSGPTRPAAGRRTRGRPASSSSNQASPGSGRSAPGSGRAAPGGSSPGAEAAPGSGSSGGGRRTGDRRRQPNRATPGSTSYDAAEEEPFDPDWSGATWYGASSGTYWTINPKEYADPRKHGPEYQRRARRSATGRWILDDDEPAGPTTDADPELADDAPADAAEAAGRAGPAAWAASAWSEEQHAPGRPTDRAAAPRDRAVPNPFRRPGTPTGRIWLALLGWPPLGLVVANAIGETSGCGRFAAGCAEVFAPGTWIVQAAIIVLLLALPRLALWSSYGTVASLAAAVPTAVLLSAGGGSRQPQASAVLLAVVLAVAYISGVAFAVARDRRSRSA